VYNDPYTTNIYTLSLHDALPIYDDYGLAYAGKSSKTPLSFKTATQPVTGISLDKATLSLETGKTATLKATVAPTDATNKGLNWASTDEAIATVDNNGKVTGVKAGEATAVATTDDGGKTAEAKITVTEKLADQEPTE